MSKNQQHWPLASCLDDRHTSENGKNNSKSCQQKKNHSVRNEPRLGMAVGVQHATGDAVNCDQNVKKEYDLNSCLHGITPQSLPPTSRKSSWHAPQCTPCFPLR